MKLINMKWLFLIITLSAGFAFNSCKKGFLDVNKDPNRVTDANITPELIFPQAANAVGVREANVDFLFLDHWMGYIAQNGQFAPQQNELTYNIDFSFGNGLFVNHFDVLFDLHQSEVKGLASGDTALAGASIILSAKLWQELVDLYQFCQEKNLYLFVDGARLGHALTAETNDLTLEDFGKYTDAFYLGGTKNGALIGEAIIINNESLQEEFGFHLKQKGAMLAKGRLLGIQFQEQMVIISQLEQLLVAQRW